MPHDDKPFCRTSRRGDGHSKTTAPDPASNRTARRKGFADRAKHGTRTK